MHCVQKVFVTTISREIRPLHFPDLNSRNFYLQGVFEDNVYINSPDDNLKESIQNTVFQVPLPELQCAVHNGVMCVYKCKGNISSNFLKHGG